MSLIPFKTSTSFLVSGPTKAGKSQFTYKLLQQLDYLFEIPVEKVLFTYKIWQPIYDDIQKECKIVTFHQNLPDNETLDKFTHEKGHKLFICDDLMQEVLDSPHIETLFTAAVHHLNLSIINIQQNFFQHGKHARTISLNASVLILFQNHRDNSQIIHLGKQIAPGKNQAFVNMYRDATKKPYSYLVIDCDPSREEEYRFRTNIFKEEEPIIVYELI